MLKGIVHPKMKNVSLFTHPQVVPNMYVFFLYRSQWGSSTFFNILFKYLLLCSSEERNSHRFGTTWRWVKHNRMFIVWCAHSLLATNEPSGFICSHIIKLYRSTTTGHLRWLTDLVQVLIASLVMTTYSDSNLQISITLALLSERLRHRVQLRSFIPTAAPV